MVGGTSGPRFEALGADIRDLHGIRISPLGLPSAASREDSLAGDSPPFWRVTVADLAHDQHAEIHQFSSRGPTGA